MFCIEEKIRLDIPCDDCFKQWTEGDYYPHFQHVKANLLQRALYCHIKRTFNFPDREVKWGEVLNKSTDSRKVIWWRCTEYTLIEIAGVVAFEETPQGTSVRLTLLFNQPNIKKIPENTFDGLRTSVQDKLKAFKRDLMVQRVLPKAS